MQETWEEPLEEEMATYSNILPGISHGQRSLAATVHRDARVGHKCETKHHQQTIEANILNQSTCLTGTHTILNR